MFKKNCEKIKRLRREEYLIILKINKSKKR